MNSGRVAAARPLMDHRSGCAYYVSSRSTWSPVCKPARCCRRIRYRITSLLPSGCYYPWSIWTNTSRTRCSEP